MAKAIYINIDPYLQAVADWLNAGKSGDPPKFSPLPVAVTIPPGESAAMYFQTAGTSEQTQEYDSVEIDGQTILVGEDTPTGLSNPIAWEEQPGFSAVAPSSKYAVAAVSGDTTMVVTMTDSDESFTVTVTIPVLVQFEKASGPVDLVDFTPPAAAPTAAQINAALGGTGAEEGAPLAGVGLDDMVYGSDAIIVGEIDGKNVLCVGVS